MDYYNFTPYLNLVEYIFYILQYLLSYMIRPVYFPSIVHGKF